MPKIGSVRLSRREREVADLVAGGLSNREVGKQLFISERTVEYHVEQIFNKLGFHSRSQIAGWVAAQGKPHEPLGQRPRTNLRIQLTSFVGRESELGELHVVLEKARLLTLVGPGGIGKTRLALELAAGLSAKNAAVTLVELAPISDGALVVQAIASAASIPEVPGQPLLETVVEQLGQASVSIVFDNCEHLVGAAAAAAENLLQRCPGVRVVATSREPLKVPGEVIWQVTALTLPPDDSPISIDTLGKAEAIRLFVDRAQHADRRFSLDATNARAVSEICRQLDGLPLAIELAAARLSVMGPQSILENLGRRFELLTGGGLGSTSRHRSLEAALQWSYELLSPAERLLFERLAIFSGGFGLEAAEHLCSDARLDNKEVLPVLLRLCERSLLTKQEEKGHTRYRMLETLRQFAGERLEPAQIDLLKRRHAEYFDTLATQAFRGSMTQDRIAWTAAVDENIDNIRSAFDWALTAEPALALRLAANLEFLWRTRTYLSEGLVRVVAALHRFDDQSQLRVQGLSAAARLASLTGRAKECLRYNEESLKLARKVSPPTELWFWIARAGMMLTNLGDPLSAARLLREGLAFHREGGDEEVNQYRRSAILADLGWALCELGDLEAAVEYSNQALDIVERGYGNSHIRANAVDNLAFVELRRGDLISATNHFRTHLDIGLELHDFGKVFLALDGLASVATAQSRSLRAMRLFGAADSARRTAGRAVPVSSATKRFVAFSNMARDGLGGRAADKAWAEGAAMTINEAVAYALADQD